MYVPGPHQSYRFHSSILLLRRPHLRIQSQNYTVFPHYWRASNHPICTQIVYSILIILKFKREFTGECDKTRCIYIPASVVRHAYILLGYHSFGFRFVWLSQCRHYVDLIADPWVIYVHSMHHDVPSPRKTLSRVNVLQIDNNIC